ncbi:MAG: sigma-70 family RNA polymerase sigma factor [Oscillospiraceae bacterium]
MTNEQLAEFIKAGGNDELTPILWERVRKLLYAIANKYYSAHSSKCERCGVTVSDLKQAAYSAYLGAVRAYDGKKGYQFTSYLDLQFKSAVRPLFGKDLLNVSDSLNAPVMADNESDTEVIELVADETSLADFERIYKSSTAEILCRAVDRLPDELKSVIYCRYYKDLSFEMTAKRLDIAENEALNRERRAIRLLRNDKELRKLTDEYMRLGLL